MQSVASRVGISLLCICLFMAFKNGGVLAEPQSNKSIPALIRDLSAPSFQKRERAYVALKRLGNKAAFQLLKTVSAKQSAEAMKKSSLLLCDLLKKAELPDKKLTNKELSQIAQASARPLAQWATRKMVRRHKDGNTEARLELETIRKKAHYDVALIALDHLYPLPKSRFVEIWVAKRKKVVAEVEFLNKLIYKLEIKMNKGDISAKASIPYRRDNLRYQIKLLRYIDGLLMEQRMKNKQK